MRVAWIIECKEDKSGWYPYEMYENREDARYELKGLKEWPDEGQEFRLVKYLPEK
jgi:hypothetical protein